MLGGGGIRLLLIVDKTCCIRVSEQERFTTCSCTSKRNKRSNAVSEWLAFASIWLSSYLWVVGNGGMGYNCSYYYYHSSIPYANEHSRSLWPTKASKYPATPMLQVQELIAIIDY